MTKKQVQRFAERHVLPALPGFVAAGDLVLRDDGYLIARGFAFNRSQLDKRRFAFHAWAQPLFEGLDFVSLALGRDLGEYRLPDDDAAQRELGEHLVAVARREQQQLFPIVEDYGRFERHVEALAPYGLDRVYAMYLKGCAALLDGRSTDAERWFGEAVAESATTGELPELAGYIEELRGDPAVAAERLRREAQVTVDALRLPIALDGVSK